LYHQSALSSVSKQSSYTYTRWAKIKPSNRMRIIDWFLKGKYFTVFLIVFFSRRDYVSNPSEGQIVGEYNYV